jgi:hypothetical protein
VGPRTDLDGCGKSRPLPSDTSPVTDTFDRKQEQPTKQHINQPALQNKLQEDLKKKETGDRRKSSSKIRLQKKRQSGPGDGNVSFACGEHEMKKKQRASESSS